jgi:phage-related protein
MHGWTTEDTLIAITAVTSIGILIQACIVIAMFIAGRKALTKVTQLVEDAREHLTPVLATSRSLLEDVSPKIKVITTNLTEVSEKLRHQSDQINSAVDEVVGRTRNQAARVDGIVTGTLDGINNATASLQEGISAPVRKVTGFINGIRAALDVLLQRARTDHSTADRDLFI